jgi:hypothetical protein
MPRIDKRRSWYRKRRNQSSQTVSIDYSLINPISNEYLGAISDLNLRDLQPMITSVIMSEDKIHLQVPVLDYALNGYSLRWILLLKGHLDQHKSGLSAA